MEQPAYVESECSDRFPCFEDVEAWEERIRVPDGFKASYFAILYNFIVLGWVLKGMGTVAETVMGLDPNVAVIGGAALALSYALLAGFWGVVITDVIDSRLELARTLGATRTVNVTRERIADVQAQLGMFEGFDD